VNCLQVKGRLFFSNASATINHRGHLRFAPRGFEDLLGSGKRGSSKSLIKDRKNRNSAASIVRIFNTYDL